jgi:glycosyltransferase involved in cell wall biosynthesis
MTIPSKKKALSSNALGWVAPSDRGGGAIWVADSCCRMAAAAGQRAVLLTLEPLSASTAARLTYEAESLDVSPPYMDTPSRFIAWVRANRPEFVFLNNVDTMDDCIENIPRETRCIYVVHDTMSFYHRAVLRYEHAIDGVIAVSEETARRFRSRMKEPEKLRVIHNGSVYPPLPETDAHRDDLIFLGGDDPRKGAYDLLKIWPLLLTNGFSGTLHWLGRMEEGFLARVANLPERSRINIPGHIPRAEVFALMARSRAFLMLSRAEACSIAVLESMAMGCEIVAWNIAATGTKEIVPQDVLVHAPLGDVRMLAKCALVLFQESPINQARLADHARTHFSEARMWAEYQNFVNWIRKRPLALRPHENAAAQPYAPPRRASHLVPRPVWNWLRPRLAQSARTYYFVRNLF